jgi:hypothetical protein
MNQIKYLITTEDYPDIIGGYSRADILRCEILSVKPKNYKIFKLSEGFQCRYEQIAIEDLK